MSVELFNTDFVVVTPSGEPLRYAGGDIGLWAKESVENGEITLEPGESFLPSDQLVEPFKTELINQIEKEK